MGNKDLSYEEALKELEIILKELEEDELSLEKSIETFKRGVKLYEHCNKLLSHAEGEVKLLLSDAEGFIIESDFFKEDEGNPF